MPSRSTSSTAGSIALGGAARGEGDDLVVVALHAQRAVGELGRERGIRSVESGAADARRQQQVGVRLVVAHGLEHLERDEARRRDALVARRPGCGAPTAPVATPCAGAPVRRPAHRATMPSRPAPRHQSAAAIAVRPAGCTRTQFERLRSGADEQSPAVEPRARPARAARRPDAAASSSTFSRWSSSVVHAPGSGVTPRNRLRTASAGAVQSSRASSMPSFGANVGSPCCGDRRGRAAGDRVDHPGEQVGAVDRRARRAAVRPWHPVRSRSSAWRTRRPRRARARAGTRMPRCAASPAMSACCTGAAPRHAGSSEKCRLIQPWRGVESSGSRTRPP